MAHASRQRLDRKPDGTVDGKLDGRAITVRPSRLLRAYVDACARDAEMSAGAFVRLALVQVCGAPPEQAMPTSPVEATVPVPVELAAVGELDRHVRRLNGAIVQLTKELRVQGAGELLAEAEVELAGMRDIQRRFRAYLARVATSETAARRR